MNVLCNDRYKIIDRVPGTVAEQPREIFPLSPITSPESMNSPEASISQTTLWSGRILSAIPAGMLLLTGTMKLMHPPMIEEGFRRFGIPQQQMLGIGLLEVACTLLYVIPGTGVLGALLLTGYIGGAIMTAVRIGDAWILPFLIGVLLWGGLWLRDPRLRNLLPVVRKGDGR
jgi:DoxX-like family